jgi:anthranilate phosphoribosyltransferase
MMLASMLKSLRPDGGPLAESDAHQIMSALLDGGIPEFERGAAWALLESRPPEFAVMLAYQDALTQRCFRMHTVSGSSMPVVLPTYWGTREQANLLPLLALMLRRLGVPVLIHGALDSIGGTGTPQILREMGIFPSTSLTQAQTRLEEEKLAFVPVAILSPGLADLMALRGRLGFGLLARRMARLLDPFGGQSLNVLASSDDAERGMLRELLCVRGSPALLLEGTENEPFADPGRRPALELIRESRSETLFAPESSMVKGLAWLPPAGDAVSTAAWTSRVLAGAVPLPLPLVNQLACCLYGTGYTEDLNQAKAIVAVESGSLIAA